MKNIILFSAASLLFIAEVSSLQTTTVPAGTLNQPATNLSQPAAGTLNKPAIDVQIDRTKSGTIQTGQTFQAPNAAKPVDLEPNAATMQQNFVSDNDLKDAIYKAIRADRIFTTDSKIKIMVTVYNGKVTLSGDVSTQAEKDRAELLANQINHLKGVTNNIKVLK